MFGAPWLLCCCKSLYVSCTYMHQTMHVAIVY